MILDVSPEIGSISFSTAPVSPSILQNGSFGCTNPVGKTTPFIESKATEYTCMTGIHPVKKVSQLVIREYDPLVREKTVNLFKAGMADNRANATDEHTLNRIDRLLERAIPQFDHLDTFLHAENGGKMFLATTPSNDVIGMFAVGHSDRNIDNEEVEFTRISIASGWRGKGVCRLLHDHAVHYSRHTLRAKSAYLITLSSVAPGMKAYVNLGFKKGYDNVLDHRGFDIVTNAPVLVQFWKPL